MLPRRTIRTEDGQLSDRSHGHGGQRRSFGARLSSGFVEPPRPRTRVTLDIVIDNAAIVACPETRIGNGWEAQFATNHLGHVAVVNRLG